MSNLWATAYDWCWATMTYTCWRSLPVSAATSQKDRLKPLLEAPDADELLQLAASPAAAAGG